MSRRSLDRGCLASMCLTAVTVGREGARPERGSLGLRTARAFWKGERRGERGLKAHPWIQVGATPSVNRAEAGDQAKKKKSKKIDKTGNPWMNQPIAWLARKKRAGEEAYKESSRSKAVAARWTRLRSTVRRGLVLSGCFARAGSNHFHRSLRRPLPQEAGQFLA